MAEQGNDPLLTDAAVDPALLASTIAGGSVFFVAVMPALLPERGLDGTSEERLEALRDAVLRVTRRLLGTQGPRPTRGGSPRPRRRPLSGTARPRRAHDEEETWPSRIPSRPSTGARAWGRSGTPIPASPRLRRRGAVQRMSVRDMLGPDMPLSGAIQVDVYAALSYDAVAEVLRDGQRFSSSGYALSMGPVMGRTILEMDEPEHGRYRRLLQHAFSRKALERWEHELVAPVVSGLVDRFAGRGSADLVRELTFPFPVSVIAGMIGVPEEDLADFHRWAIELISVSFDPAAGMAASQQLGALFARVLEERRREPRDDLMSVLAFAEIEGTSLTDQEIVSFCRLLAPAGAETTYRSSSNLLFGLLTHPDQLEALRRDRGLLPQAIEEGLRWEAPLTSILRVATCDTTVCGTPIPAGGLVAVNLGAANRDPARWERPDRVRHPAPAADPHGLRVRAASLPRHASGDHGDERGAASAARSAPRAASRSLRRRRPHHRRDLPRPALASGTLRGCVARLGRRSEGRSLAFRDEFPDQARIEAGLTAESGPFAMTLEPVLGEKMAVFRERAPSLRTLLAASAAHGARDYIVQGERRISFAAHERAVASVAAALRERFGIGPGDRVAIFAANCPEWIVTWWATVCLGAIAVGMNGWWVEDELLFALEDCRPKLLVGDTKRLARLAGARTAVPIVEIERDFDRLWRHDPGAPLPAAPIHEDDPACILYTSGTTGRPKGAVNTHRNIVALQRLYTFHGLRALMAAGAQGAAPQAPCSLMTTPLFHLSGLYTGAVTLLASGVTTVWTEGRFDPLEVMRLIEREKVTTWGPMGTMFHRVATHPALGRHDLGSVRQLGSGGAPISPALQQRMREVFPNARSATSVGYGLTEATGLATLNFGAELERRPNSVGRALPTLGIEIRGPDGEALPEGVEGEICLRGPVVMKEYWGRPDATREAIGEGRWLRTGDVGRVEDGYLFVNARARDLILRGAENVYPGEIEQRLEAHPAVAEAAVVGVDHEDLGQEVKAIVVPRAGARLDAAELGAWVGETLAYFKVPSRWEIRDEALPRNASGKLLKRLLVEGGDNPFREE